jgi:hypothetical protein
LWQSTQLPWNGAGLLQTRKIESQYDRVDVENMLNNFLVKLGKKDVVKTPAKDNLFNLGTGAKLNTTFVAKKGLFLCKRARPYIQQAILVPCTRVKDPNQADWEKLMRVMLCVWGQDGFVLFSVFASFWK